MSVYFLRCCEDVLCVLCQLRKVTFLILASSVSFLKILTNLKSGDSSRHNVPEMFGCAFVMQVLQIFSVLCSGM